MERRDVVGGGLLGLTALFAGGEPLEAAPAAAQQGDGAAAAAIDALNRLLQQRFLPPYPELAEIRAQQNTFLKATHKYPEFIDVGLSVWDRIYDWHVQQRLTPPVVRRADGRYTMVVMMTTVVLRPEQPDNYVGFGYDRA